MTIERYNRDGGLIEAIQHDGKVRSGGHMRIRFDGPASLTTGVRLMNSRGERIVDPRSGLPVFVSMPYQGRIEVSV